MNIWLLAAALLQAGLFICGFLCIRAKMLESVVAMEMASAITVISVALLAEGMGRPPWFDLAIALALLSFPSGMVILVFMERWL
ncbi:MAG: monovalent cation/H+ antiporter complex subunit F [Candidatus Binataceae bacterium]